MKSEVSYCSVTFDEVVLKVEIIILDVVRNEDICFFRWKQRSSTMCCNLEKNNGDQTFRLPKWKTQV